MRRFAVLGALIALALFVGKIGWAATVTVNPSGGAQYTSLNDAVTNFASWKTGTDNTIILVDGKHPIAQRVTFAGLDGETLAIRAAAGANPIILPGDAVEEIIRFESGAMTATIDGLLFIGSLNESRADLITPISVATNSAVNLTVQNCVFTINDGSDAPVLNCLAYSASVGFPGTAMPGVKRLRHGIAIGYETAYPNIIQVHIKDSVFYGTIRSGLYVAANLASGSLVEADGCIFITCGEYNVYYGNGANQGVNFVLRNCALNSDGYDADPCVVIRGGLLTPFEATFTLEDSIIWKALRGAINQSYGGGVINVIRSTVWQDNGDNVQTAQDLYPPKATFNFTDSIFRVHDGFIRFDPSTEPNPFTAITGTNLVVVGTQLIRGDQHQSVKDALAAMNGGSGPIPADPGFATTVWTAAMTDGKRKWDSTDNNLLDITNAFYLGMATAGADLTGGAEFAGSLKPLAEATAEGWVEQFTASTIGVIYNEETPAFESLIRMDANPTMTNVGWGGWRKQATDRPSRQIQIYNTINTAPFESYPGGIPITGSTWIPATGPGFLIFNDDNSLTDGFVGTYFYTLLPQPIDLSVTNSRVQWDAWRQHNDQATSMRVMLKTAESGGWILSNDVTVTLPGINAGGSPAGVGGNPAYSVDPKTLTWSQISNATTAPAPDLDGTDNGLFNDAGPLTIGAAVATPNLGAVRGFGLYMNTTTANDNELSIDAIRLTGPINVPNQVRETWTVFR